MRQDPDSSSRWPALPYEEWRETCATLHLWLQIVGKVVVAQCAWINHSWHVALRVTARGLATPLIPHGDTSFQVEFDFIEHRLFIRTSDGDSQEIPLKPQSTAAFYRNFSDALRSLRIPVAIHPMPNELPDPIRFDEDEVHASYDREYVNRYWRVLVSTTRVFEEFRARFIGKCSPVHYFWGSADLAVTRFSGRTAPEHPGGIPNLPDRITREAYSHEVSSAGFWAGGDPHPRAIFYSYAYPEPPGFASATVLPAPAHYNEAMKEFVLPYDDMRRAASPEVELIQFLQTSYEAAAELGHWDRDAVERKSYGLPQARGPAAAED